MIPIILLLSLIRKYQQLHSSIQLFLLSSDGCPICDVHIIFYNSNNYPIYKATSCHQGRLYIPSLPNGIYTIKFIHPYFQNRTIVLNLNGGCYTHCIILKQNFSSIYGYIYNNCHFTIENAFVCLYKINWNNLYFPFCPIRYTYTDQYGFYYFYNIPKGHYLVKSIK